MFDDVGFGARLRDLIERSGASAASVGAALGVSKQAISTWMNGTRVPKRPTAETIARYFGVGAGWLLGEGESDPLAEAEGGGLWHAPLLAAYAAAPIPTQRNVCKLLDLPHIEPLKPRARRRLVEMIVYEYPAAAGAPLDAESDFERLPFPADEIPEGADFGVRIRGDSMEPSISDGDVVWVQASPEVADGQIGIFRLFDGNVCKRVRLDENGRIARLASDNPAYSPIEGRALRGVAAIGRVL